MMRIVEARPGTEQYEDAIRGYVLAERVNSALAKPGTKEHDSYLSYVRDSWRGEPVHDHGDEYRYSDARWELIGNALRHYRDRDETTVKAGRVYLLDDFPVGSAPHGVEVDAEDNVMFTIQVHIRERLETFEQHVDSGPDNNQLRVSLAQMAIVGCGAALQIDYYEDADRGIRELYDHLVMPDRIRSSQLLGEMQMFAAKSRFRWSEAAA
jgi:hypothetical protein